MDPATGAKRGGITEWLETIMTGFGAGWVMWLLIVLSVLSVAIILERAWFFHSLRDDLARLATDLRRALDESVESAMRRVRTSPSAEAAVVLAGLETYDKGPDAAQVAMEGAAALQRLKLERRLAYLATVGNNAPFVGLFGTVIGIVEAFKALGEQARTTETVAQLARQSLAPAAVMGAISEALVATAVGIAVAIPAVAANNFFQRSTKRVMANTEALSKVLLAHMKADPDFKGAAPARSPAGKVGGEKRGEPADAGPKGPKDPAVKKADAKKRAADDEDEESEP